MSKDFTFHIWETAIAHFAVWLPRPTSIHHDQNIAVAFLGISNLNLQSVVTLVPFPGVL